MFCIVAFLVLAILGVFSASHRKLAVRAFDCVVRRVTLRPCNTGFKEEIKGKILSRLVDKSTFLAKVFNKYYEVFSWIFIILMLVSTVWTIRGVYNFYAYGSCNGLNSEDFCVFDPSGKNNQVSGSTGSDNSSVCKPSAHNPEDVSLKDVNLSLFPSQIKDGAKNNITFIGCYSCDYTRKVYPDVKKLLENNKNNVNFNFLYYPTKDSDDFLTTIFSCVNQIKKDKIWELNDYLFTVDKSKLTDQEYIKKSISDNLLINKSDLEICINSLATKNSVENLKKEVEKTNFYGTPTIFINDKVFIGPKPYRIYKNAINN